MAIQYGLTHRNNALTDIVTQLGATSYLLIYTGSPPVNCAASPSGTQLVALPGSPTFGTVANGILTANAISQASASSGGTAGYWRACTNSGGTTCIAQGLIYPTSTLTTNAQTTSGNVLPFASTSGISAGQTVSGPNIPANAYVLNVAATTITLNVNITGTVNSGATITFGGDLTATGGVIFSNGETINVTSLTITANGA